MTTGHLIPLDNLYNAIEIFRASDIKDTHLDELLENTKRLIEERSPRNTVFASLDLPYSANHAEALAHLEELAENRTAQCVLDGDCLSVSLTAFGTLAEVQDLAAELVQTACFNAGGGMFGSTGRVYLISEASNENR